MTHYEQQVRRELEALAERGDESATQALKNFNAERVGEFLRAGAPVSYCVAELTGKA
jgi:hypothetical protein